MSLDLLSVDIIVISKLCTLYHINKKKPKKNLDGKKRRRRRRRMLVLILYILTNNYVIVFLCFDWTIRLSLSSSDIMMRDKGDERFALSLKQEITRFFSTYIFIT